MKFMSDDLLQEVLNLRKEVAEIKAFVMKKDRDLDLSNEFLKAESLDGKLSDFLHYLRIPINLSGRNFLREAIKLVHEDPELIGKFSMVLYPKIAKKYNSTPSRVERSIRHAIETAWFRNKSHPFYKTYFQEKPTNSVFIVLTADKVTLEEKLKSEVQ